MTEQTGEASPVVEQVQTGPAVTEQAPATTESPEQGTSSEAVAETSEQDSQEQRTGLSRSQRRTQAYHRAKLENYELKESLAQMKAQLETLNGSKAPPKPTDYPEGQWDPKFIEETATFHADTAVKKARAEWEKSQTEIQQRSALQSEVKSFAQKAFKANPQLETLAQNFEGSLPEHVNLALARLSEGPKVLEHILRNPDLADDLNEMSPFEAAIQLGEIQRSVSLPPPTKATKAPAPINALNGGATPQQSEADLAKGEDVSALIAKWRAQKKARA